MRPQKQLLTILLAAMYQCSFAQSEDHPKKISHFSGSIGVTQNGISLVPTFSLGDPAALVMLSVGKGRLSFEPDLRFALEGKPWSFLFWWRYKAVDNPKFRLRVGAHPALNFRTQTITVNGDEQEAILTRRFLAGELAPNYFLTKNISVGMYYLYGRGFQKTTARNTHFLTVNTNFSSIPVAGPFYLQFTPQVYYLRQDKDDGFFVTATLTAARKNFPFSVSSIVNKELSSDIPGAKDFVWNVTLTYSFGKQYVVKN